MSKHILNFNQWMESDESFRSEESFENLMENKNELSSKELPEIPSDYIEPYLVNFISHIISIIATTNEKAYTIQELRARLRGVEHFVSEYCGIHSRLAFSNELRRFDKLTDEQLKEICREAYFGTTED